MNTPPRTSLLPGASGFYVDHKHLTLSPRPGTPGLGPMRGTKTIEAELHTLWGALPLRRTRANQNTPVSEQNCTNPDLLT